MMIRARLAHGSTTLILALAVSLMNGCYEGTELADVPGLPSSYWVSFSEDTQDCSLLLGEFRLSSSRHQATLGAVDKEVRLIIDRAPQEGPSWTLRGDQCIIEESKRPVALCLSSLQRIIYTPNLLTPERQCTAEVITPQNADLEMLTRAKFEGANCCERYNLWSLGEESQTLILEVSQRGELSGEISQRVEVRPYSSSSIPSSMPSGANPEDNLSCRELRGCELRYHLFASPIDISPDL